MSRPSNQNRKNSSHWKFQTPHRCQRAFTRTKVCVRLSSSSRMKSAKPVTRTAKGNIRRRKGLCYRSCRPSALSHQSSGVELAKHEIRCHFEAVRRRRAGEKPYETHHQHWSRRGQRRCGSQTEKGISATDEQWLSAEVYFLPSPSLYIYFIEGL